MPPSNAAVVNLMALVNLGYQGGTKGRLTASTTARTLGGHVCARPIQFCAAIFIEKESRHAFNLS